MTRSLPLFALGFGLLTATACGGGDTYHCDFVNSEDPEPRCQERTALVASPGGLTSEAFQATCETARGDGGDGPCPTAGIVAGCDVTSTGSGEQVVDWYYAPETAETIAAACAEDGGVVVDP